MVMLAAVFCESPQGGGFACFSGHDASDSDYFRDSPGRTCRDDASEQEKIRQRVTELGKIISKLQDVGDPALVDLVAARKAEKEVSSSWPSMHGTRLRKHRQVGEEMEALRLLLEAKDQAWMVAASAREVPQQEVGTWATRRRREQEHVSAAAMQGAHAGTPQHWAAGFAAALPPEVARQFRSWLGSVSPDAMRHHLDNLDVLSNSATSVLSTSMASAVSRAPSAFTPFRPSQAPRVGMIVSQKQCWENTDASNYPSRSR